MEQQILPWKGRSIDDRGGNPEAHLWACEAAEVLIGGRMLDGTSLVAPRHGCSTANPPPMEILGVSKREAVGEASNDVGEPVWWKRLGPVDKCESLGR